MTDFIPSFATEQLLPPWYTKDARVWIFVIPVADSLCQAYLDSHFNSPGPDFAPFRYQALPGVNYGLLCFVNHANLSSEAIGSEGLESVTMREMRWMFPAHRFAVTPDNLLVGPDLVWVKPFVFVDSSYVMFSSREIWGDEADMARIVVDPGTAVDDLHVDVGIQGIKSFNPRSVSHEIGFFHIHLNSGSTEFDLSALIAGDPDLSRYWKLLSGQIVLGFDPLNAFAPDATGTMEINILKQFRDVFDMRSALYRALVASTATYIDVRDPVLYDGSKIDIDAMWSDSVAEALTGLFGLQAPAANPIQTGHPLGDTAGADTGIDWDLPRVQVPVAFGMSFTANARFGVLGTLHRYGLVA